MMTVEEILAFWFGNEADDAVLAQQKAALWWSKNSKTDADIRARFQNMLEKAAEGELSEWQTTPRGRLALILLTDQFPRCIYRETARAFAYDPCALKWCLYGLDKELDLSLRLIERVFFYLPLEHAERLDYQERSVRLFQRLLEEAGANQKSVFQEFFDFAVRHREIILRFGRFPHRNRILGRESTRDEMAFLSEPGSSF